MVASAALERRFKLDDATARDLAAQFGTPLYVVDESHFRAKISGYRDAFAAAWPKSEIAYASKANSTLALLAIAHSEGCEIDVASEGEFRAALRAGVPAENCHFHGSNKQRGELEFALANGIGKIVVDHFGEVELLAELGATTPLVLRLAPGVDPITHAAISTGQADTKFGFNIADGSARLAIQRCLELGLNLKGFHCHVGSQLLDPEAQRAGGIQITDFALAMLAEFDFKADYLNVGGGLGVRYTDADEPMAIRDYCRLIVEAVMGQLDGSPIQPTLAQEPGRSLIAESGVTLYRVGVVKTVPAPARGTRTYIGVDGGLSDNPRPALYGAKYPVSVVPGGANHIGELRAMTISGKHCETDKLFEDIELPDDIQVGDLIQVETTGAYNSSMASNYNRYPRPATVLRRSNGTFTLIQRRESWDEMLAREIVPEGLNK